MEPLRHAPRMDEQDVVVRAFAVPDAGGVAALAEAEGWPTFADVDRVRRLFVAPGVRGVVAVDGPEVVGAAQVLTDGHHAYLTFLVVAADHRRQGIARDLVAAAFEASGAERMDLLAAGESVAFYESLPHRRFDGFRVYPDD